MALPQVMRTLEIQKDKNVDGRKGLDSQEREVTNRDATHLKMYPVVKLK